jgi:hypothetical protein
LLSRAVAHTLTVMPRLRRKTSFRRTVWLLFICAIALSVAVPAAAVEPPSPGPALPMTASDPIPTTTPTFSWSAVAVASYYALWIADADAGSPVTVWFTPMQAGCGTGPGACTVAAPRALAPGLVSWKVITWNSSGYGPWSTTATLVVSVPDPATPTSTPVAPSGPIATRTPTYAWQAVGGAISWYQLSVTDALGIVHDFWNAPSAICDTTFCSHRPDVPLPIGPARWRVRAFSGLGAGAWSADTSFDAADTAPGAATLVAPVNSVSTTTPEFTWNAVLEAGYYLLRFVDRDNVTVDRWYRPADAGCPWGIGICRASLGALTPGPASWQVLTWNASGYGPWSERHDFVMEVADPLAPTLSAISPSGVITTTHPTYAWTAAAGVTAYRLSIHTKGEQPVDSWYTPSAAGCIEAPTCSATPQAGLPNGTTNEWQVQAWTTRGAGLWTAPMSFTVSIAVPRPVPSADQQASAVRLVEYGWDTPHPEFVRAQITEMERRPFNGVVMRLPDGGGDVFRPEAWDAETLAVQLPILRGIRWQTFDSNFLAMYAASSMDWYNDADWRVVLEHAAFMARAAREGNCRGLMFDPEPYGPSPWTYAQQPHASTHTFREYEAVVRERGRAFMRALQQEYPGLELLTFHSYSYFLRTSMAPDLHTREAILKDHAWGLLPSFLDGMLEEVDPYTQIIDGHEQSYYSEGPEDFAKAAAEVREGAFPWVSSELWNLYAGHVQGAQPLYLDWISGYFKTSASGLGDGWSDAQRARLAEHHAYHAMKNVDRYVWVYSEKMNWWTGEHLPPGAEDALRSAQRKFRAGESLGFDLTSISEGTP